MGRARARGMGGRGRGGAGAGMGRAGAGLAAAAVLAAGAGARGEAAGTGAALGLGGGRPQIAIDLAPNCGLGFEVEGWVQADVAWMDATATDVLQEALWNTFAEPWQWDVRGQELFCQPLLNEPEKLLLQPSGAIPTTRGFSNATDLDALDIANETATLSDLYFEDGDDEPLAGPDYDYSHITEGEVFMVEQACYQPGADEASPSERVAFVAKVPVECGTEPGIFLGEYDNVAVVRIEGSKGGDDITVEYRGMTYKG